MKIGIVLIVLILLVLVILFIKNKKKTDDAGQARYTLPPKYGISFDDCNLFCGLKDKDPRFIDACNFCQQHPQIMTPLTMHF